MVKKRNAFMFGLAASVAYVAIIFFLKNISHYNSIEVNFNIAKSSIVVLALSQMLAFSIVALINAVHCLIRKKYASLLWLLVVFPLVYFTVVLAPYTYPYDCIIENDDMVLCGVYTVEKTQEDKWLPINNFGEFKSLTYDKNILTYYGIDENCVDTTKYSYILSFGKEAEKVTYNVWHNIASAKYGKLTQKGEYDAQKVYLYQIKRVWLYPDN